MNFTKDNFKELVISKIDLLASEYKSLKEFCEAKHLRYETIRNAKYKGYISDLIARKLWIMYINRYDVPNCIFEAVDPIMREIEEEYGLNYD